MLASQKEKSMDNKFNKITNGAVSSDDQLEKNQLVLIDEGLSEAIRTLSTNTQESITQIRESAQKQVREVEDRHQVQIRDLEFEARRQKKVYINFLSNK